MSNRFHGLSVEEAMLDDSVENTSSVSYLLKINEANHNLADVSKIHQSKITNRDNQDLVFQKYLFPEKSSDQAVENIQSRPSFSNIVDETENVNQQLQPAEAQMDGNTTGDQGQNIPEEIWQNKFICLDYNVVLNKTDVTLVTFQKKLI